ncbi:MAG TPA: Nif3-like dinuclear metal center hexameric protein, partial [Polyangiaceae bacterium]
MRCVALRFKGTAIGSSMMLGFRCQSRAPPAVLAWRAMTVEEAKTVADLVRAMEEVAPARLAEAWDNVGLLVGDPAAALGRVV